MPEQPDWRFCIKCNAMFWDGLPDDKGVCPGGGGHNAEGLIFRLPYDMPPSATAQDRWRFCHRCYAMFWENSPNMGLCPLGGGHEVKDSYMFVLPHTGVGRPATLHMWVDGLRCHTETPGFLGIGDGDEPFVLVGVIDLQRANAAKIPPTDVVLYGPLKNVEDLQNRSFPFRPFWVAPFASTSAIFLTAILEHDTARPSLTRTAVAAALKSVAVDTAGAPREQIVSSARSEIASAVEPFGELPAVVNRLIGPPAELQFSSSQIAEATFGGTARQTLRFRKYGDYSVHFLMRRN